MDVYIFQADLHCIDCGVKIKHALHKAGNFPADTPNESSYDSDDYPKGLYPNGGGESDSPAHCGTCGVFLENPLTSDGQEYVKQALLDKEGDSDVLETWGDFYDYIELKNEISELVKKEIKEFLTSVIPEWKTDLESMRNLDVSEIQITFSVNSSGDNWAYQTGDNSYSGSCYGHPVWAVDYLTLETESNELIDELIEQLEEVFSQSQLN